MGAIAGLRHELDALHVAPGKAEGSKELALHLVSDQARQQRPIGGGGTGRGHIVSRPTTARAFWATVPKHEVRGVLLHQLVDAEVFPTPTVRRFGTGERHARPAGLHLRERALPGHRSLFGRAGVHFRLRGRRRRMWGCRLRRSSRANKTGTHCCQSSDRSPASTRAKGCPNDPIVDPAPETFAGRAQSGRAQSPQRRAATYAAAGHQSPWLRMAF